MATAIVLADAQATPVNHTFNPSGLDANGVYWFVDRSQANAVGYWKISVEVRQPAPATAGQSSNNRVNRIKIGLHEPILETMGDSSASGILPAPTVAYVPRAFTEYVIPERASSLDRENIQKMSANLLDNAQIAAIVKDLTYVS